MISHVITRGGTFGPGWFSSWFTHGLASEILVEADIKTLFFATERTSSVKPDSRKANAVIPTVWKYPKDLYDVAVDWTTQQFLTAGTFSLSTLVVTVKDDLGADVTGALLVSSGISGLVSWAQIQNGTAEKIYTVIFTQTFSNGTTLERYVKIEVRNPRTQQLSQIYKYPNDKYYIPIQWAGRLARGAVSLGALVVKAYDALDVDDSVNYISGALPLGTYSIGQVYGGSGGVSRLIEFAQAFDNGRKFHEYLTLTVLTPPA